MMRDRLTKVHIATEPCDCSDPWRAHWGFAFGRAGEPFGRHYPHTYRSWGKLKRGP